MRWKGRSLLFCVEWSEKALLRKWYLSKYLKKGRISHRNIQEHSSQKDQEVQRPCKSCLLCLRVTQKASAYSAVVGREVWQKMKSDTWRMREVGCVPAHLHSDATVSMLVVTKMGSCWRASPRGTAQADVHFKMMTPGIDYSREGQTLKTETNKEATARIYIRNELHLN